MSKANETKNAALWQREEILELAERSADIGVWDIELATGLARGRPQFFRLMGLEPTPDPVPIETFRKLRHPDDRRRVTDGFHEALASGKDRYEIEYRIVRPDGQLRWIFGRGRVLRDADGKAVRYSGVDIDITERKLAEAALAASEERYRALVENANDIVATLDLEFRFTSVNPAVTRVLGYGPEEIIGVPLSRFVPPHQIQMHKEMLQRKLDGEPATRYEMLLTAKDGQPLTLEVSSKLIRDACGTPVEIHSIARDVSDRKHAEARQVLLVRELQHRTKNMLAVIQSIASNTIKRSDNLESAHDALVGRLHALAHAQEFVASGPTGGAPLRELVEAALSPFAARARLEGDRIVVGSAFAQMFALVVHELATNAAKYGSLSSQKGRVAVRWTIEGGPQPRLQFSWVERGGPAVQPAKTSGFGTQLISLVGSPTVSFNPEGLEYQVSLPLAEILAKTSQ